MSRFPFQRLAFTISVSLVVLATVTWAAAQSQTTEDVHLVPHNPAEARPGAVIDPKLLTRARPLKVNVNLVLVPVTVMDAKNRPVMGLNKEDFALYEGAKPQQIQFFSSEDAPISVGVILDLSGSMGTKIDTERRALAEFFNNANPADDYFVITFSSRPQVTADTTQSFADIQAKLATAKPAGYTALLDAIYLGVQKLRSARYERRALLIISDGGDNASRYSLREIKSLVQEADLQIYGLEILDDGFPIINSIEQAFGRHLMTQVTEATGGRTKAVKDIAALPEAAGTISRELRSQYVLGYRPANGRRKDEWRKIKIEVAPALNGPFRRAYYKKGYFAPTNSTIASSAP